MTRDHQELSHRPDSAIYQLAHSCYNEHWPPTRELQRNELGPFIAKTRLTCLDSRSSRIQPIKTVTMQSLIFEFSIQGCRIART